MAHLQKFNRPVNPRTIAPGDIVLRPNKERGTQYLMVGEWLEHGRLGPGHGTRTLMNLETGENEQVSEEELENLQLTTDTIKLTNERILV